MTKDLIKIVAIVDSDPNNYFMYEIIDIDNP